MLYVYVSLLPRDNLDNDKHGSIEEIEKMPRGITSVYGDLTLLQGKELSPPKTMQ